MAKAEYNTSRNSLHVDKLEDFKSWAKEQGWEVIQPKNIFEALRMQKDGRIALVHRKDRTQAGKPLVHLTVHGVSADLVRDWLRARKAQT